MANFNNVVISGNVTREIELRHTPQGTPVCDVGVAINKPKKDAPAVFVDVTCWGRQAEVASEYLGKGSPVGFVGELEQDRWEDGEGNKRSKMKVKAGRVLLMDSKGGGQKQQPQQQPQQPQPQQQNAVASEWSDDEVPF